MKRFAIIVILIFMITLPAYADQAAEIFQEANSFYFKKDYINAIRQFRILVNDYRTSVYIDNALFGLASSFFELENFKDAIMVYNKIVDEHPNSSFADDALFRLGECYEKTGEFNNAIIYYERLTNQYSNSILTPQAREKIKKLNAYRTSGSAQSQQQPVSVQPVQQRQENQQPVSAGFRTQQSTVIIPSSLQIQQQQQQQPSSANIQSQQSISQQPQQPTLFRPQQQPSLTTNVRTARPQVQQSAQRKIVEHRYLIRPEDTLTSIAEKFYGDFNLYTVIADYNNIADPTKIQVGETILIPVEESVAQPALGVEAFAGFPIPQETYTDRLDDYAGLNQPVSTTRQSTDDAYIYSYKLERDRQHYENLLNVEKDKRKHLLDKIRTLEMQISRMSLEIETYKNNLNSMQDLKVKFTDIEKSNLELMENLKLQKQREIVREAKNKADLLKLQKEWEDLNNKYNVVRAEFESKKYDEIIAQKEQQLAQASVMINQLNIKLQNIDTDNQTLRKEIEKMRKSSEEADDLRAKVINYQQQIVDKSKQLIGFETENKTLNAATKTMADSIMFYQTQFTDKNKKIDGLENELKILQTANAGLADNISTLQSQFNMVSNEKQKIESANAEFLKKLMQKENDITNLTKNIDELNKELTAIKNEYNANSLASSERNKQLETVINALNTDKKTLNDELTNLKSKLIDLQKQSITYNDGKLNAEKTMADLTFQLENLKKEYAQNMEIAAAKNRDFETLLKNSNADLQNLRTKLEEEEKLKNSLKDENSKTNQNIIALQYQLQKLQSEQVVNIEEISNKHKAMLDSQLQQYNIMIDKLNSDIIKRQNENNQLKQELTFIQQQNNSLKDNLSLRDNELRNLRANIGRTENETIIKLKETNEGLNSQIVNLQKDILNMQKHQYSSIVSGVELKETRQPVSTPIQETPRVNLPQNIFTQQTPPSSSMTEMRENTIPQQQQIAETLGKIQSENNKKIARDFVARGILSKNRGDFRNAEASYRKAIELDSDNADAYNHLAMLFAETDNKKLDIAIDLVNKAISLNPQDRGYYYDTLGWIYYNQANYENARKFIASALELIPVNDKEALATVYYHYGMVYLKLNNENQAFFQFIEVMKNAPANSEIYMKAQQQANRL